MEESKKKRIRSPNYPAIGLEEALAKLRELYEREKTHPTPVETASKHWGYKSLGAGGGLIVAALTAYGLVNAEGSGDTRKISVNDVGRRLLLDSRPDSSDRRSLLKGAALSPKLHSELWEKWHYPLPSDDSIHYYLVTDRGFNEKQVNNFITQYKATLLFAHLSDPDKLSIDTNTTQGQQTKPVESQDVNTSKSHAIENVSDGNKISFSFPYRGSNLTVHIEVSGQRLTPAHIARVRKHLELTESDLLAEEE